MTIPVQRKVKVINATYVEEAESIVILGECEEGRLSHQINRSCFSYGDRTEKEIIASLKKTAEMMIGKTISMVFDPDIDGKIDERIILRY